MPGVILKYCNFRQQDAGKICWEVLRDRDTSCDDCNDEQLLDAEGNPTGRYLRESRSSVTGKWYSSYVRAIKWEDDRFVRLKVATDITQRKLAEVTLQKANDELEKGVRERTRDILEANTILRQEAKAGKIDIRVVKCLIEMENKTM
jgi:hypothetical protein